MVQVVFDILETVLVDGRCSHGCGKWNLNWMTAVTQFKLANSGGLNGIELALT